MPPLTTTILPSPDLLGLPPKFNAWRRNQAEAVLRALDSPKRFVVLGMPTGFGKSLVYMACAMLDDPAVILTSTKGLQNQLITDFGVMLRDIRGMNNYECIEGKSGQLFKTVASERFIPCDEGPCLSGWQCPAAASGCLYFDSRRAAAASHVAVTNYSYWMAVNGGDKLSDKEGGNKSGPPLGHRGRLVLDEAHAAVDELGDYLAVEIGHWEVEGVLGRSFPSQTSLAEWRTWARTLSREAVTRHDSLSVEVRSGRASRASLSHLRELRNLARKLDAVAQGKGEWVLEETRDRRGRRVVRFDPVWPGGYAESALFLGLKKVVLTSATIRPKTLELLGVEESNYEFIEYPSSFPVYMRPFIWCPTVRVRHDMDPGHARQWVAKIDAILRTRPDRKGVIHTVSYARRDFLLRYSEFRHRMVVHDGARELQDSVARFRDMHNWSESTGAPVLVSPSVGTGFDFPGDDCRFQILSKVPFPDTRSRVLEARQKLDPEFFAYITAQQIVQAAGRGVRSPDDWCETLIIDDNWQWMFNKYRKFFPQWFIQACRRSDRIPEPLNVNKVLA